jgi:hypothetical protein
MREEGGGGIKGKNDKARIGKTVRTPRRRYVHDIGSNSDIKNMSPILETTSLLDLSTSTTTITCPSSTYNLQSVLLPTSTLNSEHLSKHRSTEPRRTLSAGGDKSKGQRQASYRSTGRLLDCFLSLPWSDQALGQLRVAVAVI